MRFTITGRNIEVTEGLRSAVESKLGKLEKYFDKDVDINVTLSVEKDRQKIEVTIPVKGSIIRSEQTSSDMYVSIDLVEEVIERQLKKYKNKIIQSKQAAGNVFTQDYIDKDYSQWVGHTDRHPLVSVIDYAEVSPVRHSLNNYSIYGIFFHDEAEIDLAYGCGKYDYKKGTVICVAPGQIGGKEDNGERVMLTGWALLFHPDLLHGTPLERTIKNYSFFDYRVNEALHMSDEEHGILTSLMCQIRDELWKRHDEFQDSIIVGYIELVLNFCQRFYNRQFITRKLDNSDMLMKFDRLLHDYFDRNMQLTYGLPTVQYCADKLCMSSNYFGDMIKKTTGDTASNYIRQYIIQLAKNELATGESIAQVAYGLGFEYPQHLSRMFKKQTGMTPSNYFENLQRK